MVTLGVFGVGWIIDFFFIPHYVEEVRIAYHVSTHIPTTFALYLSCVCMIGIPFSAWREPSPCPRLSIIY